MDTHTHKGAAWARRINRPAQSTRVRKGASAWRPLGGGLDEPDAQRSHGWWRKWPAAHAGAGTRHCTEAQAQRRGSTRPAPAQRHGQCRPRCGVAPCPALLSRTHCRCTLGSSKARQSAATWCRAAHGHVWPHLGLRTSCKRQTLAAAGCWCWCWGLRWSPWQW